MSFEFSCKNTNEFLAANMGPPADQNDSSIFQKYVITNTMVTSHSNLFPQTIEILQSRSPQDNRPRDSMLLNGKKSSKIKNSFPKSHSKMKIETERLKHGTENHPLLIMTS